MSSTNFFSPSSQGVLRGGLTTLFFLYVLKLFQQFFLSRGQVDRCLNDHPAQQIAGTPVPYGHHAFTTQPE